MEDFDLRYDLFLAENELIRQLVYNENTALVLEASTTQRLLFIEEGFKDSIKEYLNKIITGIQKAWDSFKNKITNLISEKVINPIKAKAARYRSSFKANNAIEPNVNMLSQYKVVPFSYVKERIDTSQGNSITQEVIVNTFYPNISSDDSKTGISEKVYKSIVGEKKTIDVDGAKIISFADFALKGSSALIETLKNDIKIVNETTTTIDTQLNANSMAESIFMHSTITKLGIVTEADDSKKDEKMTFTTDDGETVDSNGKDKENNNLFKTITNWAKVSCGIISGKLKALFEILKNNFNILKFFNKNLASETEGNASNQKIKNVKI